MRPDRVRSRSVNIAIGGGRLPFGELRLALPRRDPGADLLLRTFQIPPQFGDDIVDQRQHLGFNGVVDHQFGFFESDLFDLFGRYRLSGRQGGRSSRRKHRDGQRRRRVEPLVHLFQHGTQRIRRRRFDQDADGAGRPGFFLVGLIVLGGVHRHRNRRGSGFALDLPDGGHPIQAGHGVIHENRIGALAAQIAQRLFGGIDRIDGQAKPLQHLAQHQTRGF